MKYLTVLITDTHFGTHNSSMTWLKSQKEFFDKQLLPHLQERKKEGYSIRVVHCGDVFDSRSTVNTYIATAVVDLFSQICDVVDKFVIVGGNHDYFSPELDDIDTVTLIFNQLHLKYPSIFNIVSKSKMRDYWGSETCLYVPWYEWIKQDDLVEYLENSKQTSTPISRIFTHADIVREQPDLGDIDIVSGHIHVPYFSGHLLNLGSCFALTFTDNNSARGFYEYEDSGELKFIENQYSIRFWRFYDDEILEIPEMVRKDDYVELYVSKNKIAKKKYTDAWSKWTEKFKNIWRIPQDDDGELDKIDIKQFEGYNIETMTEGLIPGELKDKFEQVKQYINIVKD